MLLLPPRFWLALSLVTLLSACEKEEEAAYTVSTFAGRAARNTYTDQATAGAAFHYPVGVATDAQGNVYIADTNSSWIRHITPAGVVSTLAGRGPTTPPSHQDGPVASAVLHLPRWLATDAQGNVYVTAGNRVRCISPAGQVTTLAGSSTAGMADGPVSVATFNGLQGIAVNAQGTIYVADWLNHRIRQITPAGQVSTLAGGGPASGPGAYVDGVGSEARFSGPYGLALDRQGNLYVTEVGWASLHVRKVTPAGEVSTVAAIGTGQVSYPYGIAVDGQGTIFVTEQGTGVRNHRVHKITAAGTVSLVAGDELGYAEGRGVAARFFQPGGIAVEGEGNLYVADTENHAIRKISPK